MRHALCAVAVVLAFYAPGAAAKGDITLSGGPTSTLFPAYRQCDREAAHSPFTVQHIPTSGSAIGFTVHVQPCNTRWACCSQTVLNTFELSISPMTQHNIVGVLVDGMQHSFQLDQQQGVFRVTKLNKDTRKIQGTTIVIETTGLSEPVQQLCTDGVCSVALSGNKHPNCCPVIQATPSTAATREALPIQRATQRLPISSQRPGFPWVKCSTDSGNVQLTASQPVSSLVEANTAQYCFKLQRSNASTSGPCSAMDLFRLDIDVQQVCMSSVAFVSVDGIKRPPFFQTMPAPMLKITNLEKEASDKTDTEVCVALQGPCSTWDALSATGLMAVHNDPYDNFVKCCPVFSLRGTDTAASK